MNENKDRLTSIVTKTGDAGSTGLADGSRVVKSDPRIHALGDVDELSSCLGELARRWPAHPPLLRASRAALFDIGAHLAMPGVEPRPMGGLVEALGLAVGELSETLGPLADFILPGGSEGGAWAHVCRSVCRRAERSVSALGEGAGAEPRAVLNRLSDWLFCVARDLNQADGVPEELWRDARGAL